MARIAFIGVGDISGIYLQNITETFSNLEIAGVCDLIPARAQAAKEKYPQIPKIYRDMHEAFADPNVDIILNITRAYQHYEVTKAALEASKHVYSEKPLATTIEQGIELIRLARAKGLLLGGAPDTFLGAGIQTCKRIIDAGFIGRPLAATAFMMSHGVETWHPDPEFFYKPGAGPMLDMGPYYTTALVHLLGPVKTLFAMTQKSFETRIATCKPKRGMVIEVETPTYVAGTLRFTSGATASLITSFETVHATLPRIEIYGEKGTLTVPDPNTFGGPVTLYLPEEGAPREMPLMFAHRENSRALGLSKMAEALDAGTDDFITSWRLTGHALDIMTGMLRSGESGAAVEMCDLEAETAPGARAV
ncbi:MAG: Gfo/Idh/MocA family protein [Christensenellales bacterium]|jgi:predicted dehydrogenase